VPSLQTSNQTNEPYWDDEVYFRVPGIAPDPAPSTIWEFGPVARRSDLRISVWDSEGYVFANLPVRFPHVTNGNRAAESQEVPWGIARWISIPYIRCG